VEQALRHSMASHLAWRRGSTVIVEQALRHSFFLRREEDQDRHEGRPKVLLPFGSAALFCSVSGE
jgi:hypothetical protein